MALPHCSPGSLYSQSAGTPPPPPLLAGSGFCCVPLPSRGRTLKLCPGCSLTLDSLPHTSAFLISAHRWHSFSHPSSPLHRCLLCPLAACWSQLIPACRKFPDLFQWCPAGSQHLRRWVFPSHFPPLECKCNEGRGLWPMFSTTLFAMPRTVQRKSIF